jgi:hypothetical protein
MSWAAGIFVLLLGVAATAAPRRSVYLPRLGPGALRYEEVAVVKMVLPPLLMEDPSFNPENSLEKEFLGPPLPPVRTIATGPVRSSVPLSTNQVSSAVLASRTVGSSLPSGDPDAAEILFGTNQVASPVSAQLLVQFFQQRNGSNRPPSVVLPVGFNPPPAITPATSSTATYVTPPP